MIRENQFSRRGSNQSTIGNESNDLNIHLINRRIEIIQQGVKWKIFKRNISSVDPKSIAADEIEWKSYTRGF